MNDGKLQQVGTPLEVYDQPGQPLRRQLHRHAADELHQRDDPGTAERRSRPPSFSLPVPASLRPSRGGARTGRRSGGHPAGDIVDPAGSRRAARRRSSQAANVEIVEPLGDEVIVHGRVGDETAGLQGRTRTAPPEVGEQLEVQLELDALHLFDAENENRLGA